MKGYWNSSKAHSFIHYSNRPLVPYSAELWPATGLVGLNQHCDATRRMNLLWPTARRAPSFFGASRRTRRKAVNQIHDKSIICCASVWQSGLMLSCNDDPVIDGIEIRCEILPVLIPFQCGSPVSEPANESSIHPSIHPPIHPSSRSERASERAS